MWLEIYKNTVALIMLPIIVVVMLLYFLEAPIAEFEKFVREYSSTIIALGTLFLVSALALLSSHLSNTSAEKRETFSRRMQQELKLSEFRQNWIDTLREDISALISLAYQFEIAVKCDERATLIKKMKGLDSKIRLRLNPFETPAQELDKAVVALIDSCELECTSGPSVAKREELARISGLYLKNEWDELKGYLSKASDISV